MIAKLQTSTSTVQTPRFSPNPLVCRTPLTTPYQALARADTLQSCAPQPDTVKNKESWTSSVGNAASNLFTGLSSKITSSRLSEAFKKDMKNNKILGVLKATARAAALTVGSALNTAGKVTSLAVSAAVSTICTAIVLGSLIGLVLWFVTDISQDIQKAGQACGAFCSKPFSFAGAACINSALDAKDNEFGTYEALKETNEGIATVGSYAGTFLGIFAELIVDIAKSSE
ncbi:MAG: hypothetical protein ACI9YB_000835 [Halioglobus sp.]|jgi:hypothetical protein